MEPLVLAGWRWLCSSEAKRTGSACDEPRMWSLWCAWRTPGGRLRAGHTGVELARSREGGYGSRKRTT